MTRLFSALRLLLHDLLHARDPIDDPYIEGPENPERFCRPPVAHA